MASDAARDRRPAPEDVAGPAVPPTADTSAAESVAPAAPAHSSEEPSVPSGSRSPAAAAPAATEKGPLGGSYPAPPNAAAGGFPFPYGNAAGAAPFGVAATAGAAGAGAGAADSRTFYERLAAAEDNWQWKIGMRAVLLVLDLIGIGTSAAIVSQYGNNYDWYYFGDSFIFAFNLIPLGLSFIWCLIVILVLLLRRPPLPVHPGVAVGLDLVLWLAFLVVLLFSVSGVVMVSGFGSDPNDLQVPFDYGSDGTYTLAPNGTWVYSSGGYGYYYNMAQPTSSTPATPSSSLIDSILTSDAAAAATTTATAAATPAVHGGALRRGVRRDKEARAVTTPTPTPTTSADPFAFDTFSDSVPTSSYSYSYYDPFAGNPGYTTDAYGDVYPVTATTTTEFGSRPTDSSGDATRDCGPYFSSCAQQDAYVNQLWQQKPHHMAMDITTVVVLGLALILHFALFVWACVDTNRRNVRRRLDNAMALNLLHSMQQRGYVMVPAGEVMGGAGAGGVGGVGGGAQGGYYPYPAQPQEQQFPGWPASSRAADKAPAANVPRTMPRFS